MENTKTRESILKQFIDFFRSFTDSGVVNDGKVTQNDLSEEDKRELKKVLAASGNVRKIEAEMGMGKYKAKVDTNRAKRSAALKKAEQVVKDKTRDNK